MLLFYDANESTPADSNMDIDGIECAIWRHDRLGTHPRDLYRLADRLEGGGALGALRM